MANLETVKFYLEADTIEEAANLAIDHCKSIAVAKGCIGFSIPQVTHQDLILINGIWKRGYEFTTELIPN